MSEAKATVMLLKRVVALPKCGWIMQDRGGTASGGYRASLIPSEISTLPNHSFQLQQDENMSKVSSRTVRVTDIPEDVAQSEFLEVAKRLASTSIEGGWFSSSTPGDTKPTISFASQFDGFAGTITLPSEKHKVQALEKHDTEWRFDDKFNGITVLCSPTESDLDICAVHGLNGNAFDTWVAKTNNKMWLRDILPTSKPFDKARIMTFGYSSQLIDRANLSGVSEWAHHLLTSISSVRQTQEERQRPIIFICHSMGGIVARQAMVRLNEYSHKSEYKGVDLKLCGILFLSTPHSGSTDADWNSFLIDIAQMTLGVRPEILKSLESFNPLSAEAQEDFANMKHQPPFDAFYETQKTKIAKLNRHIVTRQSASLAGQIASPMLDVDHNTICKFDSKIGGFMQVADKLRHIRDILMNNVGRIGQESNKPWIPPPTALNCYRPPDKWFFEGLGLNQRSKLTGRESELKNLKRILDGSQKEDKTAVSITGIGATLLEIAHQNADERNIFFVHAHDAASLHQAYLHIAKCIGPEYLLKEYRGQDLQGIWSNESPEDKVGKFKVWLKDPENTNALFLLDDMDGIQLLEYREAAFPDEAKTILYTTRNPVFHKDSIRLRHKIRLSTMDEDDTVKLMENMRSHERDDYDKNADLYDQATLIKIVKAVQGHPLAASNAVVSQYKEVTAGRRFVDMLNSDRYEDRFRFLDYGPDSPSIMETFKVSQERLPKPNIQALAMTNFLSMIETEGEGDFDFRDFFFEHSCPVPQEEFPDHELLASGSFQLNELFSELEKVSFGERVQTSKPFQFHPLWLECTRHSMGHNDRVRYARQVLLICYHTIIVDHGNINITPDCDDSFLPHVRKCLSICKSFKIGLDDLKLRGKVLKVFRDFQDID
ncbi:hypothetical protein N431DRAFT_459708 [Stipitochalara longipes BDJ]|nr:hypothetical protein N431DRAFT_459708 [Stipitochalara longipes BDJ]